MLNINLKVKIVLGHGTNCPLILFSFHRLILCYLFLFSSTLRIYTPSKIYDTIMEGGKKEDTTVMVEKICNCCGKEAEKRCSTCGDIFYCSVECQRNDWSTHKKVCGGGYVFKVVSIIAIFVYVLMYMYILMLCIRYVNVSFVIVMSIKEMHRHIFLYIHDNIWEMYIICQYIKKMHHMYLSYFSYSYTLPHISLIQQKNRQIKNSPRSSQEVGPPPNITSSSGFDFVAYFDNEHGEQNLVVWDFDKSTHPYFLDGDWTWSKAIPFVGEESF